MTSDSGKLLEEINSTSNTTRHQKFRGLLKRKAIKIFRDDLFRFFDYLYTIAPSHLFFVTIMKYLHFIQIGILSFFPYSSTLWPDHSLLGQICKVLSVCATIIPVRTNVSIHLFFEIILYLLFLSFIIFFFVCFKLYHVYTKISIVSIKLITIIMNSFLPFLISITSSNLGLDLFLIVMHNKSNSNSDSTNFYYRNTDYNFVLVIINFILGWIELVSMIIFQIIFVTPSLTFRPQAIHILSPQVSFVYFFFIFIFSFSTTFSSIYEGCGGYVSLFFVFICIFPIGFLLYNLYSHFEVFVTKELHQILMSLFHMIVVDMITLLAMSRLKKSVNEVSILTFILIFCISYYIITCIVDCNNKRNLQILDKIEENESILSKIQTNKYLQLLRTGFDTGHPLCHSWKLFKMADRKMATNKTFLIIFARYAAIYPDESMMLNYVCRLIKKMKHNNIEMKYLVFQINNLLQQRERGLSKTIKKTCNKISDKTEKCRDQLRLVWQSVINGSTSDLDDLANQLKKNEDEVSREYSQLCFVYPNNPYIASAYSAFLSDILCDDKQSEEYATIYRLLRSGAQTRVERSYCFATMIIKTLPDVVRHNSLNQNDQKSVNNDNNKSTSIAIGNVLANNNKQEDVNEEKTQQRYIEMLIDSVRLPSIRYGPFLLFLIVSLIFPVLSIPLLYQMISNLNKNQICINIMELFSLVRTHLCQLSMTSYYYALSKNRYVTPLVDVWNSSDQEEEGVGGGKSDESVFLSSVNDCVYTLNMLNKYYPKLHGTELYKTTLPYLNSPLIYFDVFTSITNKTESMWSFQHISSFIGLVAVELSNKKNYQMLKFPELRTLVSNSVNILYQSRNVANTFIDSFSSMNDDLYHRLLYLVVGIGGGMLILAIFIIIIVFTKMNKEKNMLYDSFKTLPKSTISSIVEKIDAQSGKHVDQETVVQPLSFQEQTTMRILNLSSDRKNHINQEILIIVVISLISLIAILFIMIFSIYTQKKINNQFPLMTSTIFDLTRIHSTFFTLLLTEMRIAAMNNEQLKSAFPEDLDYLIQQCVDIMNIQTNNIVYLKFGRNFNQIGRSALTVSDLICMLTNSPTVDDNTTLNYNNFMQYISLENKIFFIHDLLHQIYVDLLFQYKNETQKVNETQNASETLNSYETINLHEKLSSSETMNSYETIDSLEKLKSNKSQNSHDALSSSETLNSYETINSHEKLSSSETLNSYETINLHEKLSSSETMNSYETIDSLEKLKSNKSQNSHDALISSETLNSNETLSLSEILGSDLVSLHRPKLSDLVQINDLRFELILHYLLKEENQTFLYNGLTFIYNNYESLYYEIKQNRLYLPIIITDAIILICGLIVVFKFVRINERAKWTMKLLLFCPASIVFQSQTISKLLSNDFTKSETDENEESSQFYENVVAHYPDPVVFINKEMRIVSINNAFCSVLKKEFKDVKNKLLGEVLNDTNFLNVIENILNEGAPPFYNGDIILEVNKEMLYFNVSLVAVNMYGEILKFAAPIQLIFVFTLTMINRTEFVRFNENYKKEKESMKSLLAETIPKNFLNLPDQVPSENNSDNNVKSPYANICFKVRNVSVVVIEIIGIRSLSSHSIDNAADFVSRLNSFYGEIDQIISNYGEMIKVSSTSGTFVIAGGVLNDSLQLQSLSKNAILLSSDIISALEKFNLQTKNSLTVKVGIETGGPVVAGVLDLSRPVFELFGNPVSIAFELKETGKQNQIHVSQSVFEYCMNDKFNFKEDADVDFKDQTIKTYLV